MLRVGVFLQADDDTVDCNDLLVRFRDAGIEASAYRIGRNWEELDGDELVFNFQSLTHFVIIPRAESFVSRWLPLLVGFASGGDKFGCFLVREDFAIPHYLVRLPRFKTIGPILEYIEYEAELWQRSTAIERAREALTSIGIGINEENFAARVAMGDEEAVENFLKVGYSPDTCNALGIPLICLAVRNGHRNITQILLDREVNVNVLSQDRGNSPLMEAAVRGDQHSTRLFLESGADPDLISKSGQTALMMAVGEGHKEIVAILREFNAGTGFVDNLGMTAKKYAEIFQHKEILELLNS